MSTPVRVGVFLGALAVVFGAAFGAGRLFEEESVAAAPLSLRLADLPLVAGAPVPIAFTVGGADGATLTEFAIRHDKPLHLIAVRTDLADYRHLHPTMEPGGAWKVTSDLGAGTWRLYADFQPEGAEQQVLTAELDVPGSRPPSEPSVSQERRSWTGPDGYRVEVLGALRSGTSSDLQFRISRNERPVTDLEPYLGAYGHLVVIRDSDLDYLHAHPGDGPAGPEIPFAVDVSADGRAHLFLDFQHDGIVRTATFVLDAAPGQPGQPDQPGQHGGDHGDH